MEFSVKTDKKSLAMDLLSIKIIIIYKGEGYIQSYIDFYHITKPGMKGSESDRGLTSLLTTDKLISLKNQLCEVYIYS